MTALGIPPGAYAVRKYKMANKMERTTDFKTPGGPKDGFEYARGSYLQSMFEPRAVGKEEGAKKRYGATLIMPKAALDAKVVLYDGTKKSLNDIVGELIVAQWGDKGLQMAKDGLIKPPFLMGNGKEARNKTTGELHPGMGDDVFFIRTQANIEYPPAVYDATTGVAIESNKAQVYSGCYGFGVINFFCWDDPRNGKGISAGIRAFYKRKDGEKLGGDGQRDPDSWLDDDEKVADAGAAPASTQGGAGAGGLFGAN